VLQASALCIVLQWSGSHLGRCCTFHSRYERIILVGSFRRLILNFARCLVVSSGFQVVLSCNSLNLVRGIVKHIV
jgi:hypothetical protein